MSNETSEKARADEIRRRVEDIFGQVTAAERVLAEGQEDLERLLGILPEVREFFDLTVNIIKELHKSEEDEARLVVLDADLRADIRKGLLQRIFITYPALHVAAALTDAEVLSAAEEVDDILSAQPPYASEQIDRLASLFSKGRFRDYRMPMGDTYHTYLAAVGNLRYYLVSCASYAKKVDSFAAGRCFLKAASILMTGKERQPPHFDADEVDEMLDLFEEGLSEVLLASDYRRLTDWHQVLADARTYEAKDGTR